MAHLRLRLLRQARLPLAVPTSRFLALARSRLAPPIPATIAMIASTAITFPFPVSVYGQTFNSANVASNGSFDLIGAQAPFTHGCPGVAEHTLDHGHSTVSG